MGERLKREYHLDFDANVVIGNLVYWNTGIQTNTSELPYDKLDQVVELKTSEPEYLAKCIMRLDSAHKLKTVGWCCGTNNKHMNAIADKLKIRN